jgi:D-alanine-D-alanine ligase
MTAATDNILVLFDTLTPTQLDRDYTEELKDPNWETEADVIRAVRELGYTVGTLGLYDDLDLIRQKIDAFRPSVIFNLVECFRGNSALDQHIASVLELHGIPFTGCGAMGMTLCKQKGISKQILGYHRIRVPQFAVLPTGKKPVRPRRLKFPVFIKPLQTEASYGIAQASLAETDDQFVQRVAFIHEKFQQPAIAEEYIHGRELYCSIIGNDRLQAFPIREMVFEQVPTDEPRFASFKAKWDEDYRRRWGIRNRFADDLDAGLVRHIERYCKRIYRLLGITGYARFDLRLAPDNEVVFIEANPNPILAAAEDFAQSALKAGLAYPQLIEKIIALARDAPRC